MSQNRRDFLKTLAISAGSLSLMWPGSGIQQAWALTTPKSHERLVMIFMRGGFDGLFAIAPIDDALLATHRPTLAAQVLDKGTRLAGSGFALHPACARLAELYDAHELAFAPCSGTIDTSRSHFQAQDLFELGNGRTQGHTGFMARTAQQLSDPATTISFTQQVPLIFQGLPHPPEIAPLTGSGLKLPQNKLMEAIRKAHAGQKTGDALEQAMVTETRIESTMGMDVSAARGAAGINGFPVLAAHMGRMLTSNPQWGLAFLDLGGFDTHIGEEAILNNAIGALAEGLIALKDALGTDEWRRTRVVMMTEFGRTVRENGTKGTDHGHGGLALVAGGNIRGGRMLGNFDGLSEQALNQNRDLPVYIDWRDLLGELMQASYDFNPSQLNQIFPGRPGHKITL